MSGPPVENRNTFVSQKRVQRYNKFLNWPNIFAKKIQKKCTFFVTDWKSILLFFTIFCYFLLKRLFMYNLYIFLCAHIRVYYIIRIVRAHIRMWFLFHLARMVVSGSDNVDHLYLMKIVGKYVKICTFVLKIP